MKGNQYTRHIVKCPNCDMAMLLDDIDYDFDGKQDNYYQCSCGIAAYEQIRFKKPLSIHFFDLNGNAMKIVNINEDIQSRLIRYLISNLDDRKDMLDRYEDILTEEEKNILNDEIELNTILLGLVSNPDILKI